ncbi:carboxymuconolactone decarboxylase family protein [Niallia sp. 01092]|uniref:carboxymuconolactone decarboxylase family protein n=1 Tax=unclassified Niallia TaxID=2837522 RepID=UPI003FD5FEB8
MTKNPDYELFKKEFPEQARVFGELFQAVSCHALDEKTKQLVYLGILTANRYAPAIRVHITKALEAGATAEEIKEAMMLAIPAGGLCDFLSILPEMLDELNKN